MKKIFFAFLLIVSSSVFADSAQFLGVSLATGTRSQFSAAVQEKGAKPLSAIKDMAIFKEKALPHGIESAEFFFTEDDHVIGIKVKIAGISFFENAKETKARLEKALVALKNRYGEPAEKKIQTAISTYNQYEWVCGEKTRVVFIEKGYMIGAELNYINDSLALKPKTPAGNQKVL